MAVVVSGVDALLVNLQNIADRSSRGAREELRQGAEDIKDLAVLHAPVDEGNLEASIKVGSELDSIRHGRKMYTVYVNESLPAGDNKTVGFYAERMHEGIYNLGVLSQDKQDETGVMVGRKFLERALDDLDDEIKRKVESRVGEGVGH